MPRCEASNLAVKRHRAVVFTESCSVAIFLVSQLYKAAAIDSVEAVVAVAVRVAAGAAHAEEGFVLKVAPQLN